MGNASLQPTRAVQVDYGPMEASDPLMAEALALQYTLMNCQQPQRFDCEDRILIVSDCQTLVNNVENKNIEGITSWGATEPIAQYIKLIQMMGERVTIRYTAREAVQGPHTLATWARRKQEAKETRNHTGTQ